MNFLLRFIRCGRHNSPDRGNAANMPHRSLSSWWRLLSFSASSWHNSSEFKSVYSTVICLLYMILRAIFSHNLFVVQTVMSQTLENEVELDTDSFHTRRSPYVFFQHLAATIPPNEKWSFACKYTVSGSWRDVQDLMIARMKWINVIENLESSSWSCSK